MRANLARRQRTPAEARADAIFEQIADDDMARLVDAVARLLLSAAKNTGTPRRVIPRLSSGGHHAPR